MLDLKVGSGFGAWRWGGLKRGHGVWHEGAVRYGIERGGNGE